MTEIAAPGTIREIAHKYNNAQDDLVADYIATVVKPGDKTLQLGRSDFGTVFLQKLAYHEVIGPMADIDALEMRCERRAIRTDRLRRGNSGQSTSGLDMAIIGTDLGFPLMAGNWRRIADRLKIGGVLILQDASASAGARMADALMDDRGWELQEMIAGDVAVFRKTAPYCDQRSRKTLVQASEPRRKPRGVRQSLVAGVLRTIFGQRMSPALRARVNRMV